MRNKVALYARYSTHDQRATSLEDQLRRACALAEQYGCEVVPELVFTDAAITGEAKGKHKRAGYQQLLAAWERGEFNVLIVDELSRLARDFLELAQLQQRIERSGVRLITADGLDSATPNWQLRLGLTSVIASHATRETRHRVRRGMQGQLERGFTIGQPPFGYRAQREEQGTAWVPDEVAAEHVRAMYASRRQGASFVAIARELNTQGVPTPRPPRTAEVRYWRPATVRQLLANPVYRGVVVWNGSAFLQAQAKKTRQTLEPAEYARPELRLVDDDTWYSCNPPDRARRPRGGDRHRFAGLVQCGVCHATLSVHPGGSVPSLGCAQCSQAARCGVDGRSGRSLAASGLQAALRFLLERVFDDECRTHFRQRLEARLHGGETERLAALRQQLAQQERAQQRLARLMTELDDDGALEAQYRAVSVERKRLEAERQQLEAGLAAVDGELIARQLAIDPLSLLPQLFDDTLPAQRVRALLRAVFPCIELVDKPSRLVTLLRIRLAPGVVPAELTATPVLDDTQTDYLLRIEASASRPTRWAITVVE